MPLTPEQSAALTAAAEALQGAEAKDVADALKASLPDAYQTAFRVGYGTAKGELQPKVDAAEAAKTTAETERDDAQAQATTLAGKDTDFAAEKARLEKAAQDAKTAATEAKTAADERIKGFYRTMQDKALLAKLAPIIDPLYAENAVIPSARDRIRVDGIGEDGELSVSYLDADGVPLSGGLDALAAQLAANVDARFKTSKVDAGGGAQNGSGGGSGLATDVKRVHAEVDARYGSNDTQKTTRARLGL